MSRAYRKAAPEISFSESLDAAAMARFPGVKVETEFCILGMQWRTSFIDAVTEKYLKPSKAREVLEFIAGFSKAWELKP